jgi:hypothetical protein
MLVNAAKGPDFDSAIPRFESWRPSQPKPSKIGPFWHLRAAFSSPNGVATRYDEKPRIPLRSQAFPNVPCNTRATRCSIAVLLLDKRLLPGNAERHGRPAGAHVSP